MDSRDVLDFTPLPYILFINKLTGTQNPVFKEAIKMHYKYWFDWLLTLLVKFFLALAVSAISLSIFSSGTGQGNFLTIMFGLLLFTLALYMATDFAKALLIPWKGAREEYIPFYSKGWEKYEDYKKRMEKETNK